jgi:hypothetical protein
MRSVLDLRRYALLTLSILIQVGRDSSVDIATRYELDGPGHEIVSTRPDRPWGLPSLLYNGYRVIPGGKSAGAWRWPPTPHLAQRLKKEYSYTSTPPLGFHGLF